MRNGYGYLLIIIMISLVFTVNSYGQVDTTQSPMQQHIESIIGDDNVVNYMQPFATALGTAVNTGLYHTAKIHGLPGFDIGIRAIFIPIPDEALTYRAPIQLITTHEKDESIEVSTVFGPDSSTDVYPPGLDIGGVLFAVFHFSVGLPLGTEVNLRYLPAIETNDDIPKIELLGYGLSHSLDQYFPVPIPLLPQLSAGFMYQKFKVEDLIESTHLAYNIRLSKSVPMLTVYVGAQFETSDMDIKFKLGGLGEEKTVSLDGENDIRFTGGFRFTIFPFVGINADFSTGKYSAINIGLNFSFDPPGVPGI